MNMVHVNLFSTKNAAPSDDFNALWNQILRFSAVFTALETPAEKFLAYPKGKNKKTGLTTTTKLSARSSNAKLQVVERL